MGTDVSESFQKYSNYKVNQTMKPTVTHTTMEGLPSSFYSDHNQPIVLPNLRTSPAHLDPDVGAFVIFIAAAVFRRLALIAAGLFACTSCTLSASSLSILRRQS